MCPMFMNKNFIGGYGKDDLLLLLEYALDRPTTDPICDRDRGGLRQSLIILTG